MKNIKFTKSPADLPVIFPGHRSSGGNKPDGTATKCPFISGSVPKPVFLHPEDLMTYFCILILSAVIGFSPAFGQKLAKPVKKSKPVSAFQDLVNTERAFADLAAKKGIMAAFTANLSDSGVLFRPGPVNGQAWFEKMGETRGKLTWEPVLAQVSNSGDFGFTTGPFYYKPDSLPCEIVNCTWGQYLSVWKKNSDGVWKLMIDFGARHPEKPVKRVSVKPADDSKFRFRVNPEENTLDTLMAFDRNLTDSLGKKGYGIRIQRTLHKKALVLADRFLPRTAANPGKIYSEMEGFTRVKPVGGMVASSRDLAYTYGSIEVRDSKYTSLDKYHYLRIWKREPSGKWSVLVDLSALQ